MIAFTVFGTPAPAGSKRALLAPGSSRPVVVDASTSTKPWQAAVRAEAAAVMDGRPLINSAVWVEMRFFFPRPKAHYGTKGLRESAPEYRTQKPDVIKLARAAEDALTGVLWRDDSQVVSAQLRKGWGEPARCEIKVMVLGEEG